ncbi:hypothetical protein FRB95_003310 [Tulasnella sp. JGI-2019a]|nr:hypothetical protein FRB95_003310 [Tulasnella sp. JGI-2019a]
MLSVSVVVASLIAFWVVKRAVVYTRATQRITLPGYRNLGPVRSSLYGFVHDKLQQNVEDAYLFTKKYRDYKHFGWDVISSIYWFNSKPKFFIADPSVIQRIGASRALFPKPMASYDVFEMFGRSVVTAEGPDWARHRKITSRAFSEPNMHLVWKETTRIVKDMFDSDWSLQGDTVVLDDVMHTTIQLSMLTIMAAGFGQEDSWIPDKKPPPGHTLTFRQALRDVVDNIILRVIWPQWVWGSQSSRNSLAIAGIAGRGWLGKRVQHISVAYSELATYMREMLQVELAGDQNKTSAALFSNLVAAVGTEIKGAGLGKNDVLGNMFMFLMAGFETTAHALAYVFGLLAIGEEEQQRLYEHIEEVLQDREPSFEDIAKLTRVLAVFLEALRLYPAAPSLPKYAVEDTVFSVRAALSEEEEATMSLKDINDDDRRTDIFIPKGSQVFFDVSAVHHNPRYWQDPYAFKPERFLDPNWPRDAFVTFSAGSRACMGRRFAEVEAITIITLIIRRYKVSVDPVRCPDVPGETELQRRDRVLETHLNLTLTPVSLPLVFTKRRKESHNAE